MAINISVQHNGGLFSDIILLTQGYHPFKCHVEVLSLHSIKRYIITLFNDVLHCFCFVFAFCLMSLHDD